MRAAVLVRYADLHAQDWANGLGTTTELVGWDSGPDWRLSVARLDGPAPFSPLPGVDRTFLPVDADVELSIDHRDTVVRAGQLCRFAGEAAVSLGRLQAASAHAVNLMVRRRGGRSGPVLAVTDDADARCSESIAAVALAARDDVGRFDLLRLTSPNPVGQPLPVALLLPTSGGLHQESGSAAPK